MAFYVYGADGTRYGPGDEAELALWAGEGRLRPETELEDTETGVRRRAASVLREFPWPHPDSTVIDGVEYPRPTMVSAPFAPRRKVWVAGLLTFLLCGAGQMYNRQVAKGFAFLALCLVLGILTDGPGGYAVTVTACIDACRTARRINAGEIVGPWSVF